MNQHPTLKKAAKNYKPTGYSEGGRFNIARYLHDKLKKYNSDNLNNTTEEYDDNE